MNVEASTERTRHGAPDRAAVQARIGKLRPRLRLADTLLLLWRAKWLMLAVFLPLGLAALAITFLTPTQYTASTRLLVRPGQEHAFDPVTGGPAQLALPQPADVVRAEAELARSPAIAERTIRAVGLSRLYPRLADTRLRPRDGEEDSVSEAALAAFAAHVEVSTSPGSSLLLMSFRHENPDLAAETLNRFVDEYLVYRREVLSGQGTQVLADQRGLIEARLAEADAAIRAYLATEGAGDYEAELTAATRRLADLVNERAEVRASLREAEARSESLARQMSAIPREVDLFVESTSEQELAKLRLTREDLLARYLPDSRAVQDIERRIKQMEAFLATAPAQGLRRIGPNPTWQALEVDRAVQAATIGALTGRLAALETQEAEIRAALARLDQLKPDFLRLKRDRDALDAAANAFAAREQAERTRADLAARSVDNVAVYEAARPPQRSDVAVPAIAVAAAVIGFIAALVIGLLRVWTAAGLPTSASVERTLGLPVLAATRER